MITNPTMFAKGKKTSRARLAESLAALEGEQARPPLSQKEVAQYVMQVICEHYGLSREQLIGNRRPESIAWPRQIAMSLTCDACRDMSLEDVGKIFGGRDHGTVNHAIKRVAARVATEPNGARREVMWIRSKLNPLKGMIDGDGI